MSIGYPINKLDLDNQMGRLVVNIRDSFIAATSFKLSVLDDTTILPDSVLTSLGYSGPEITQIRASFTSLNNLYRVSNALQTQGTTNDFWFDAKHLAGLNYH